MAQKDGSKSIFSIWSTRELNSAEIEKIFISLSRLKDNITSFIETLSPLEKESALLDPARELLMKIESLIVLREEALISGDMHEVKREAASLQKDLTEVTNIQWEKVNTFALELALYSKQQSFNMLRKKEKTPKKARIVNKNRSYTRGVVSFLKLFSITNFDESANFFNDMKEKNIAELINSAKYIVDEVDGVITVTENDTEEFIDEEIVILQDFFNRHTELKKDLAINHSPRRRFRDI